jgi:hypothetical protein
MCVSSLSKFPNFSKKIVLPRLITFSPIAFIFLLSALSVSGQMRQVYNGSTNLHNEIKDIFFISPTTGFFALNGPRFGFSTDSGRTFSERKITFENVDRNGTTANTAFPFEVNGIHAFSQNEILVYGNFELIPSILYSNNGGLTFKVVFNNLYSTTFLNPGITDMVFPGGNQIGFAVDRDRVIKTTNGGQTWQTIFAPAEGELDFLTAPDNNNVIAYSAWTKPKEKIYKTTNGGNTWQPIPYPKTGISQYIPSMFFLNAQEGWMLLVNEGNSEGYKTDNGGLSWQLLNQNGVVPFFGLKMHFVDNKTGFGLGEPYTVYKTLDGGKIWEPLERITQLGTPELGTFKDLFVRTGNQLWAGGNYEYLEMSTNGGGTTLPKAYFRIDTSGQSQNGKVKAINYSRSNYTFEWFVNNQSAGNNYNMEYTHIKEKTIDTITLIVSNGIKKDTLTRYQSFFRGVVIESFSPQTAKAGDTLSIKGKGLINPVEVKFGNVPATIIPPASDTLLKVIIGEGASGNVYIKTQTGWDEKSGFIFLPRPLITNFTPKSAKTGEKITIIGNNFNNVSNINIGTAPALSFQVIGENQIEAIVPSGGSGSITISASGGIGFTSGFIAIPVIQNFYPKKATASGYVFIEGTSLDDINEITFGGALAKSFVIESSNRVRAELGNGRSGQVVAKKPSAEGSMSGFLYVTRPAISSMLPLSGTIGSIVTIKGTGFENILQNNQVYFGSSKAKIVSGSTTELKVEVPTGFANSHITIISNNLSTESASPFNVSFPNGGTIRPNSMGGGSYPFTTEPYKSPVLRVLNDFDQDGRPDLVTQNDEPIQGLYIYRNKTATGAMEISFEAPVMLNETFLELGNSCDFNGDGLPEIFYLTYDGIDILHNKSTQQIWNFSNRIQLASPRVQSHNAGLNFADVDGDGKKDIIYLFRNYLSLEFQVFKNRSTLDSIIFDAPIEFYYPDIFTAFPVTIKDINKDGKPDIIVTGHDGSSGVILNNSSISRFSFSDFHSFSTLSSTRSNATVTDIDNDGISDLITNRPERFEMEILKGIPPQANNVFFISDRIIKTVRAEDAIASADIDGDGQIDIASLGENIFSIYKNLSSPGKILLSKAVQQQGSSARASNFTITDMNRDGKPDFLCNVDGGGYIYFVPNLVTAGPFLADFNPKQATENEKVIIVGRHFTGTAEVWFGASRAASFRVINDSTIEAVVAKGSSGAVKVINYPESSSLDGFIYGTPWHTITDVQPLKGTIDDVITINGTGFSGIAENNHVKFGGIKAQVVSATANRLQVKVPLGALDEHITLAINGKIVESPKPFQFVAKIETKETLPDFASPVAIATNPANIMQRVDLNNDGKIDLLSYDNNQNFQYQLNESKSDTLAFSQPFGQNLRIFPNSSYDINGDGKQDFLNYQDLLLWVNLNSSNQNEIKFESSDNTVYTLENNAIYNLWDIDGDARPDLIYSARSSSIKVRLNTSENSRPSFGEPKGYLIGAFMVRMYHSDIDGDGLQDLIISSSPQFYVCRNLSTPGNVKFDIPILLGEFPKELDAQLIDLDGDGKTDIVPAGNSIISSNNQIGFFRNISTPGVIKFEPLQSQRTAESYDNYNVQKVFSDLDGDGLQDMVQSYTPNSWSPNASISLWKNRTQNGIMYFTKENEFETNLVNMISLADVNGDGNRDLIIRRDSKTYVHLNKKDAIPWSAICNNQDTTLVCQIQSGSYKWQMNNGTGFVDLINNTVFSGVNSRNLTISKPGNSFKDLTIRCVTANGISPAQKIVFRESPVVNAGPDTSACRGTKVLLLGNSGGTKTWWQPTSGLDDPNSTYVYAAPDVTTQYTLTSTNEYNCISRDTMVFTVIQPVTPSITINANRTLICKDQVVSFSATITHGGTNPSYQWRVGNSNFYNNQPSFTYAFNQGGQPVSAQLTSNLKCVTQSVVQSNIIAIEVNELRKPEIRLENFTLYATATEPGANYKWQQKTGSLFEDVQPLETGSNFKPKVSGTYRILGIKGPCSSFSNELFVEARKPSPDPYGIYTYPNPASSSITFESIPVNENFETISIYNSGMVLVLSPISIVNQGVVTVSIVSLPRGYYFATFRSSGGKVHTIRFFKS